MFYRDILEMSGKVPFCQKSREFFGAISGNHQTLLEHLCSHKSGVFRTWRLKSSSLGGVP